MIKHWINGKEVESKETFTNYNPATTEAIGEVASGGAEEINLAVAAAKEKILSGEIKVPATTEAFDAAYGSDYYTLDD